MGTMESNRFLKDCISPKVIIINSRFHGHETLFSKRRGPVWDTLGHAWASVSFKGSLSPRRLCSMNECSLKTGLCSRSHSARLPGPRTVHGCATGRQAEYTELPEMRMVGVPALRPHFPCVPTYSCLALSEHIFQPREHILPNQGPALTSQA